MYIASANRRAASGFTLLEILTVLVIVGVIFAIALPIYAGTVDRAKRKEGVSALMTASQQQERFFTINNAYTSDLALAGIPGTTEGGYYTITVRALGGANPSFVATATPTARWSGSLDPKCGTLTISNTGVRTVSGSDSIDNCWK